MSASTELARRCFTDIKHGNGRIPQPMDRAVLVHNPMLDWWRPLTPQQLLDLLPDDLFVLRMSQIAPKQRLCGIFLLGRDLVFGQASRAITAPRSLNKKGLRRTPATSGAHLSGTLPVTNTIGSVGQRALISFASAGPSRFRTCGQFWERAGLTKLLNVAVTHKNQDQNLLCN